jgi:nitrous oxide reductase
VTNRDRRDDDVMLSLFESIDTEVWEVAWTVTIAGMSFTKLTRKNTH